MHSFFNDDGHFSAKVVGSHCKDNAEQESPLVFDEIFVEIAQRLHANNLLFLRPTLRSDAKVEINLKYV